METEAYKQLRRIEATHWWYRTARTQVARLLARFWRPPAGSARVLDAGCGTGGTTAWLRRYGAVIGVDPHLAALRATRERGIPVVCASVAALPFRPGAFDLVTSFDVLYHANVASPRGSAREMRRVTRPGGRLVVRVPALAVLDGPHDRFVHGARRFALAGFREQLSLAGWRLGWAGYVNALLVLPALVTRWLLPSSGAGDLERTSRLAPLLFALGWLEARLIGRLRLPFGTSILAIFQNPTGSGTPE
ncbi:MAG: class I SAM-dependent methyltransferase [Chloroflexota bacterium]|nr:class I SAM-dependent methyltransferase [Chloroflexota bacterium]